MAGMMYLGNQKVTPVIVQGGGGENPLNLFTIEDGYLRQNSTVLDGTGIKYIDSNSFSIFTNFRYMSSSKITELNFPDLESIDLEDTYDFTFDSMKYLTKAYFPKLSSGRIRFKYCESLQSVNLDSVVDTRNFNGDREFFGMFYGCTSLTTFTFTNLTTVGAYGLNECFGYCTSLVSCRFPKLEKFYMRSSSSGDTYPFEYCFDECSSLEDVYFDAVKSTSFSEMLYPRWTFSQLLSGVDGCTVHFPSNMEAIIGSWSDVVSGFGGTNTTVLFDLPETE